VLSSASSGPKLDKKAGDGLYEELSRSPQIPRQRWIIFGEFVVSFTFAHIECFG